MADYREISQHYAQGSIKAVILANSGGALAILSQVGALAEFITLGWLATAIIVYTIGVATGILSWIAAFASTRHVDRKEQGLDPDYAEANKYQLTGVILVFLSLFCFCLSATIVGFAIACA